MATPSIRNRPRPLDGQIAIVAGATRGAGRGIARGLAEAGATVICTGRSVAGQRSPYNRPETIDETVEMITAAGGRAVAVRVDHTVEADVARLVERVERDYGRLDVVADSVAGEDPVFQDWGPFWTVDLTRADFAIRQALLSHIITAKHAAPLMMKRKRGLVVEVTESDIMMASGNPLAQAVKVGLKGFALNAATELKPHGIAVVAMTPGFLRSETMLEYHAVTEENWRDAGKQDRNFLESESPLYIGRAVAALAADENMLERTGQLLSSYQLAREYRFTDYDGRRPDWGRLAIDFSTLPPPLVDRFRTEAELHKQWLRGVLERTKQFQSKIPSADAARPRRPARAPRSRSQAPRRRRQMK